MCHVEPFGTTGRLAAHPHGPSSRSRVLGGASLTAASRVVGRALAEQGGVQGFRGHEALDHPPAAAPHRVRDLEQVCPARAARAPRSSASRGRRPAASKVEMLRSHRIRGDLARAIAAYLPGGAFTSRPDVIEETGGEQAFEDIGIAPVGVQFDCEAEAAHARG